MKRFFTYSKNRPGRKEREGTVRMIYLIRHGEVDHAAHRCISRTDLPLSPLGRAQAQALGRWIARHPIASLYASPAARCMETASLLGAQRAVACEALREVDVGAWENLTFEEIRARWPEAYRRRGEHIGTTAPPGGESFLDAGRRFDAFLTDILDKTDGDIAVVSHGGILRAWLCMALSLDPDAVLTIRQPRGCVSAISFDGGTYRAQFIGCKPFPVPDDEEIGRLYRRCATPEAVIAHCRAVADQALSLAVRSSADRELLRAACLLHDLCREAGRDHPAKAAKLLDGEGYPQLADIVAQHHDLRAGACAEAELLYLADKLISGCTPVPLAVRFEASRAKCGSGRAALLWEQRYACARQLANKYGVPL